MAGKRYVKVEKKKQMLAFYATDLYNSSLLAWLKKCDFWWCKIDKPTLQKLQYRFESLKEKSQPTEIYKGIEAVSV